MGCSSSKGAVVVHHHQNNNDIDHTPKSNPPITDEKNKENVPLPESTTKQGTKSNVVLFWGILH